MGVDDDASTLTTHETSVKHLVYITNISEGNLGTMKNARDTRKNPSKQGEKKISPLEKSNSVSSNNNLNVYKESGSDDNPWRDKERKKKTKNMRKIIHIEFDTDDDMAEQLKKAIDVKVEVKVQVRKNTVHYYEFSCEDKEREHANQKN